MAAELRTIGLGWVALVFAGAALGTACSNSGRGLTTEETASYPPIEVPPLPCPCIGTTDAGAPIFLDGAPDGCTVDSGVLCPMPANPTGQ